MSERDPVCTFAEMVPLFQELFDPEPGQLLALIGRMKNAQRVAAMTGPAPGRGKTAHYTQADLRQLLVIMELGHLGVPPQKASELYRLHETLFFGACGVVTIPFEGRASCIQVDTAPLRDAARRHLPRFFYPLSLREDR